MLASLKRSWIQLFRCPVFLLLISSLPILTEAGWQAGFARQDITPKQSMWLSGYASRDRGADGTRTPLWCKAMALEDQNEKQALLLTLDLIGISADVTLPVRRELSERTGLAFADILINCSHTHTGPVVGSNLRSMYLLDQTESHRITAYTQTLKEQMVALGLKALTNLHPVELRSGQGHATFGTNRRQNPESHVPARRASGKLQGPVDYDVPILELRHPSGKLEGLVFGYACHATVLNDYLWSGDYPGYAQAHLEKHHPGIQAMFWAGCGADINPLPRRQPELAEGYGKALAEAVLLGIQGVLTPVDSQLKTSYMEIPLRFDTLPTAAALREESSSDNRYKASRANKWLEHLDAGKAIPTSYPYPIGLWKLGQQVTWLSLGGEVVVDYAIRFKKSHGSHLWVAGYSHDVMAYIPSKRVWTEGGYEGKSSMIYYGQPTRWSSEVEKQVAEAVESLLLQDDPE
jgi:neutral ceramidase